MPPAPVTDRLSYTTVASPIGELLLVGGEEGLRGLFMQPHRHGPAVGPGWRRDPGALAGATSQLEEYFAGERTQFELPLAPHGTPFQQDVWALLCEIPFGETTSYGALATRLGRPDRARAVGAANGRNPISIVVPCHRVIGAGGALVGYGGGLERKRALLAHEAEVKAGFRTTLW
jgi:methylated-DNA-[protein]-cysteine S-methyltransferase